MKSIIFIFLIMIIISCAPAHTYLDETGKEISESEYKAAKEKLQGLSTVWFYNAPDTGRVSQIVIPKRTPLIVRYPLLKEKLEEITGRKFENKTFLLSFNYLNDICAGTRTRVGKYSIAKRKKFQAIYKADIEKNNKEIIILEFFEEGLFLANSPDSPDEYFFKDKDNFLKNTLFKTKAACGSHALIKPDGEALVSNGEANMWYIEKLLIPVHWNQIFAPTMD